MLRTRKVLNLKQIDSILNHEVFEAVCKDLAEEIDANLVSIWFCAREGTGIECQCAYDVVSGEFTHGQFLSKNEHPIYIQNLIEYNYISAPDVRTHPATKELIEDYFEPNGILSLLDFILHKDHKPVGVICCENRRVHRNWSEDDKSYLRKIAALVSHRFRFSD